MRSARRPRGDATRIAGHPDGQETGAERLLSKDKRRAAGRAALLTVRIGEDGSFFGDPVDVWRTIPHHAHRIGADLRIPISSPKMTRIFGFLAVSFSLSISGYHRSAKFRRPEKLRSAGPAALLSLSGKATEYELEFDYDSGASGRSGKKDNR